MTDSGNIFAATGGGATPDPAEGYFAGRFTNGFNYVDYLSLSIFGAPSTASLFGGTNFAFGGARATTTSSVPDLVEQFVLYQSYLATPGKAVDPNGLYIVNFWRQRYFQRRRDRPK